MDKRITTMLLALSIVQPPLQRFYDSSSDEQKARFNISSDSQAEPYRPVPVTGLPILRRFVGPRL